MVKPILHYRILFVWSQNGCWRCWIFLKYFPQNYSQEELPTDIVGLIAKWNEDWFINNCFHRSLWVGHYDSMYEYIIHVTANV